MINPKTGYKKGTLADKSALAGNIPTKDKRDQALMSRTIPQSAVTRTQSPVTRTLPPVASTAMQEDYFSPENMASRARATTRNQSFGVDPTTNQQSPTLTGGVPATFNRPITRVDQMSAPVARVREIGGTPAFATDQMKEKLTIRLEMGDSSLTPEELSTARDYLTDKVMFQRTQDPTAGVQKAYDRIEESNQQQIREQERLRRQTEEELTTRRNSSVQDFVRNQNTIFEPEVKQAQAQGEVQKESVRSILSFSGFGRSTETVEKLTEVDQNVDTRLRAIESQKQAETMRFQAAQEGADGITLMAMDENISKLRQQSNQLKLDSVIKIEELKLQAVQANDARAVEQLNKLQSSLLDDSRSVDVEASKTNGFLTDLEGQPIYDESGKMQTMPKNYDFGTAITSANGAVSIPVFDELSGTFKMVDTGVRERVPGRGGGGSGKGKSAWKNVVNSRTGNEIQERSNPQTGLMEYRTLTGATIKPSSIKRTDTNPTYKNPGTDTNPKKLSVEQQLVKALEGFAPKTPKK